MKVIGLRRRIALKMQEAKRHIPDFTYVEEIDVTELEQLRAQLNERHGRTRGHLTLLPLLARAVVQALREFPQINARFDDDAGIVTRYGAVHHDKTDHNWDVSWLARFTEGKGAEYEAGLVRKTRSPGLYERYTWSTWQMAAFMNNFVGDGNGYVGNLDLEPEKAGTLSLTADWHDANKEQWGLKVTPYYTYVWDYVDAVQWDSTTNAPRIVPVVDNFTVLKYFNQSAYFYGVDLSTYYVMARGTGFGDFTAKGVASYTRGENDDTGDNLYNIMPLNAKLSLIQELGPWRNTLEGEFVAARIAMPIAKGRIILAVF